MINERVFAYLFGLIITSGGILMGMITIEGVKAIYLHGYIYIAVFSAIVGTLTSAAIILLGMRFLYAIWKGEI